MEQFLLWRSGLKQLLLENLIGNLNYYLEEFACPFHFAHFLLGEDYDQGVE